MGKSQIISSLFFFHKRLLIRWLGKHPKKDEKK